MMSAGWFLVVGLATAVVSGCSSQVIGTPDSAVGDSAIQYAGGTCPSGLEPIYGAAFDASTECVDLGSPARRVHIGCLPVERVMGGLITCYVRTDGSLRVLTGWLYQGLEAQGWTRCRPEDEPRLHPNC